MTRYSVAVMVVVAASACASNVDVRYPAPADSPRTGSVLVLLTEPLRGVSVSIDGVLVAEDEHTERVHIADVPAGRRQVLVAGAGGDRTAAVERRETLDVVAGQDVSVLIPVPPKSLGHWIWSAAYIVSYAAIVIASDFWDR